MTIAMPWRPEYAIRERARASVSVMTSTGETGSIDRPQNFRMIAMFCRTRKIMSNVNAVLLSSMKIRSTSS